MKELFLTLALSVFTACSTAPSYEIDNWDSLIDPGFNQKKVVAFYKEKVSKVLEGSKEEILIYADLQKALKKAGNNKNVDGKTVKLDGYIVPVDTDGERVNKFLFFPNQAACIHVPASPANQTIYVESKKGEGILLEDAYEQIRIFGTLKLQEKHVATGTASYRVNHAMSRVVPTLN